MKNIIRVKSRPHTEMHTKAGALSAVEMERRHQAALDMKPTVARCAVGDCTWQHEGPASECREKALQHRREAHPGRAGRLPQWTPARAVEAVRRFHEEEGRHPTRNDVTDYLPSKTVAVRLFGSWLNLIANARPQPVRPFVARPNPLPAGRQRRPSWTEVSAVAAVRGFADDHGHPPTCADADRPGEAGLPSQNAARRLFGSWANMIEAAGYPRPGRGTNYRRKGRLGAEDRATGGVGASSAPSGPTEHKSVPTDAEWPRKDPLVRGLTMVADGLELVTQTLRDAARKEGAP